MGCLFSNIYHITCHTCSNKHLNQDDICICAGIGGTNSALSLVKHSLAHTETRCAPFRIPHICISAFRIWYSDWQLAFPKSRPLVGHFFPKICYIICYTCLDKCLNQGDICICAGIRSISPAMLYLNKTISIFALELGIFP